MVEYLNSRELGLLFKEGAIETVNAVNADDGQGWLVIIYKKGWTQIGEENPNANFVFATARGQARYFKTLDAVNEAMKKAGVNNWCVRDYRKEQ